MPGKNKVKAEGKAGKAAGSVTKDTIIADVIEKMPESMLVFAEHGLHCIGCAVSAQETLEQGCAAHGIDVDLLVADLNKLGKGTEKKSRK